MIIEIYVFVVVSKNDSVFKICYLYEQTLRWYSIGRCKIFKYSLEMGFESGSLLHRTIRFDPNYKLCNIKPQELVDAVVYSPRQPTLFRRLDSLFDYVS